MHKVTGTIELYTEPMTVQNNITFIVVCVLSVVLETNHMSFPKLDA